MRLYKAIAEYYDAENAHHEMLRMDVPFFMQHLPRQPQTILEVGAGTGRCALPLAQTGHKVVGVDHAAEMLTIARRKRDAAGIAPADCQFVHIDFLKFDLNKKFDWVTVFFNTFLGFTTLPQQDAFLQVCRRHMKKGGKLWLDILQPNIAMMAESRSSNLDACVFYVPRLQRTVYKTTEVKHDPIHQTQRVTFHYKSYDADGTEHHQRTAFDFTFMFPRELTILFERNGLKIEKMYGNYDGSELEPESPRIIVLATQG